MGLSITNQGLKIAKIREVKTPTRGTDGSAGIDFYIPDDYPQHLCVIHPGTRCFIPSGIKANVPDDYGLTNGRFAKHIFIRRG